MRDSTRLAAGIAGPPAGKKVVGPEVSYELTRGDNACIEINEYSR
jgi:hypothetical protein